MDLNIATNKRYGDSRLVAKSPFSKKATVYLATVTIATVANYTLPLKHPQRSLQRVRLQQRPLLTVVPSWQLYRRRPRRVGTGRQYSKPAPLTCHLNSSSLLGPIFFLSMPLLPGQKILTAGNLTFTFTLVYPASSLDPK